MTDADEAKRANVGPFGDQPVRRRVAAMYEAGLSAIEHRLRSYPPPPPPRSEEELLTACAIYLRGRAAAARGSAS